MSKRLQVLLDESELRQLQKTAREEGVPLSKWVRRTLREARARGSGGDTESKLRAVREAARHEFPTADIDQMLAEVEMGYTAPAPE
jgi:hypothetical protein